MKNALLILLCIILFGCNNQLQQSTIQYNQNVWDRTLYNSFIQYFTNGSIDVNNSEQIEVIGTNNEENYTIGYLSGNDLYKERLVLHENSTYIVLGKTSQKEMEGNKYTSIVTYESKSNLSVIRKVIVKYKDPSKCGVFIDIEFYDVNNQKIFTSNGFVRTYC